MSQYQQWLGRKREHSYHKVPITCSTGRGLSKVSAAVTGGRRLLRCLVHLDRLDRDLLSHGATWEEKGAFSLSVLIPLWPCTAPHMACHTAGTQGPRRGQVACRALEGKGNATAASVQHLGIVQGCQWPSLPFLAPQGHSTEDAGRRGPQHSPLLKQPHKARLTALTRTARAHLPAGSSPSRA